MEHVDAVANFFIEKAEESGCKDLSPMKLLKLMYYAQGWHLAVFDGNDLYQDEIQAWQYGPVVPAVYREFRDFGNLPITRKAVELSWETLDEYYPTLSEDSQVTDFLGKVWDAYGKFTPIQLSNKTHKPNTPWSKIHERYTPDPIPRGINIPKELITEYFCKVRRGEIQD